jgi:hypothetical protein
VICLLTHSGGHICYLHSNPHYNRFAVNEVYAESFAHLLSGPPATAYTSVESGLDGSTVASSLEQSALVHRTRSGSDAQLAHLKPYAAKGSVHSVSPRYRLATRRFTKEEMAARTPWRAMFTHPVALALLWCSFGYVSPCPPYNAGFYTAYQAVLPLCTCVHTSCRAGSASRCCLRCPRT